MAGRPHAFDDPDFLELVAQLEAGGSTRRQICDELNVPDVATISRWRKDPRLKRRVHEITRDRAFRVAKRIDAVLDGRLQSAESISIEVLLKMRREFVGDNLRAQLDEADDRTVGEMNDWAAENPELVTALMDSFAKATGDGK